MFKERPVKRTTIILDEEERRFIDSLIKEGKEPGIKPLISKMLDVYRSMMIYDWKFPGEYYSGISRVAFVNVEFIDTLLQFVPKEKWREVGQKIGEVAKISFEATLGLQITDRDKWPEVFKRLRIQGFGDFYLRDKYLILKAPFISNHEVFAGLLEKLLGVRLEAKTITPPFIFEIVG
ncbi:MAG: hypothetical protein OEX77_06575 [Candidatus Bathyarchaeota archaeon]|nr:hypothetical protein [Candidatus Bathyarchaeota archaeon]MDH5733533.1 hypothetical protein [Candidatus Bathyarchaeota archaeon]